jgi:hypothetical protein
MKNNNEPDKADLENLDPEDIFDPDELIWFLSMLVIIIILIIILLFVWYIILS